MSPRDLKGYRAYTAQSYAKLEAAALRARKYLFPEVAVDEALPAGVELLERAGGRHATVYGRRLPVEYATELLPPGVEGRTYYEEDSGVICVAIDEQVLADLESGVGRARFTVCHEFGHLFLHRREIVDHPGPMQSAGLQRSTHEAWYDTEWQANAFSAALLVPASGLALLERRHVVLDAFVLREHFNVSQEAAERRLTLYKNRKGELI